MARIENKIPPPLLWLLASVVTFVVDRAGVDGSPLESTAAHWLGVATGAAGLAVALIGVRQFGRADTTVDPHSIEDASTLVISGVYRFSRNPMYLGLVLLSIAWGLWLGTLVGTIVGTGLLVAALTVLQIRPEERVLSHRFGAPYDRYRREVRRWI